MRAAARYDDAEPKEQLNKRGLMNRFLGLLRPLGSTRRGRSTRSRSCSAWGFDTATEIALLVLAWDGRGLCGLPSYALILSLPILFAAGMSLFDRLYGCFHELRLRLGARQGRSARSTTT